MGCRELAATAAASELLQTLVGFGVGGGGGGGGRVRCIMCRGLRRLPLTAAAIILWIEAAVAARCLCASMSMAFRPLIKRNLKKLTWDI